MIGFIGISIFLYGIAVVVAGEIINNPELPGNHGGSVHYTREVGEDFFKSFHASSEASSWHHPNFRIEDSPSRDMTILHYDTSDPRSDLYVEAVREDCVKLGEDRDAPHEFRVYVGGVLSYYMEKEGPGRYTELMQVEAPSQSVSHGKSGWSPKSKEYIVYREGNTLSYIEKDDNDQWVSSGTRKARVVRVSCGKNGRGRYRDAIVFRPV